MLGTAQHLVPTHDKYVVRERKIGVLLDSVTEHSCADAQLCGCAAEGRPRLRLSHVGGVTEEEAHAAARARRVEVERL
eukprot:6189326-Pleurochrysis_carterae.AAC.1